MRILLAEDHTELREAIARRLRALGNSVDEVSSLREIRTYLNGAHYDVGVFDRMLPDGDSLTLLQALRTAANRTPILLLTARDRIEDRVEGLQVGADDYLVKPFAMDELLARINVLARRGEPLRDNILRIADLEVDSGRHEVRRGGVLIPLRPKEYAVLVLGIAILAKVAIDLRAELRETDLDTELALYATSVYGLTWFDQQGQFHDEILRLEHDLLDAPYDIWVVEPGNPPTRHFTPAHPRFNLTDFTQLQTTVMGQGQDVYLDGQDTDGKPYRLHAIPTFMDQGDTSTPKAMIITVADPTPGQAAYQAFVQRIVGASALLGILGLLVGVGLTAWSLRPVLAALRQRERFLAATAHELRTPVAALRSICESAQRGDEAPQLALTRMDGLLRSATHTLEDLLLFARLDAGASVERQPVRLDLLVETLLPDDDSVTLDAAATVVNLDPRLATVAVRNLLENAHKHGVAAAQSHIHVTVTGAQVTVEDQGKGFSAELLARRETDFALSPTQGGTGLGLAIVNMVARLHGGALRLENRAEGGARVTVQFLG